jgi:hypothetical protein
MLTLMTIKIAVIIAAPSTHSTPIPHIDWGIPIVREITAVIDSRISTLSLYAIHTSSQMDLSFFLGSLLVLNTHC